MANVELKLNPELPADGQLDEFWLRVNGEVVLHFARLDTALWWAAVYPSDGSQWHLHVGGNRAQIEQVEPPHA